MGSGGVVKVKWTCIGWIFNDSLSEFGFTVKWYGFENSCFIMKSCLKNSVESCNMKYENTLLKQINHNGYAVGNKKWQVIFKWMIFNPHSDNFRPYRELAWNVRNIGKCFRVRINKTR